MYNSIYNQQYRQMQQPYTQPMQMPQPTYTLPTVHADIVQVASREEGKSFGVAPGQTQMMMLRDESAIFIKTALNHGQYSFDEYYRKEPEEQEQVEYITKAEFDKRISELTEKLTATKELKEVSKDEYI